MEAGFSYFQAARIARGNQDMDDMPEFSPWSSKSARVKHHFTTETRRCEMRNEAIANKSWWLFGSYLHALQDSYSHQKGRTDRETPFGATFGHGWTPWPDIASDRPELYDKMRAATLQELKIFYGVMSGAGLSEVQ
jgi:hypothetical protein